VTVVESVRGEVITFLEMTSPGQLRPGRVVPGLALTPTTPADEPLVRATIVRVGAAYSWPSAVWSDAAWSEWFADPRRQSFLLRAFPGDELTGTGKAAAIGDVVGIVETQAHPPQDVEITSFGLLPERVGAGLGGHALTLAVQLAWNLDHPAVDDVRRVWLHTSTLDDPHALPNYRARGFRAYRTQTRGRVA
jgi:hypothetical protein